MKICGVYIITLATVLCFSRISDAENSACWGDESREDITCTKITESVLLTLRGQTIEGVRRTLKASGRSVEHGLHFISNYDRGDKGGSGAINVLFEEGRATAVNASIDTAYQAGTFEFIWNVYEAPALGDEIDRETRGFQRAPFCSDLSDTTIRCQGDNSIDRQLTLMQMQWSLKAADLLKFVEASCNPGKDLRLSDPVRDCERLREQLR